MKFSSKILFQPSFHESLELVLTNNVVSLEILPRKIATDYLESKAKLSVQEYKQLKEYKFLNQQSEKRRWKESSAIDLEEITSIKTILLELQLQQEPDDRIILDGIIVDCEVETDTNISSFSFHSPDESMKSYKLSEKLIELCFKKFKSEKAIEAIEKVEGYFGFYPSWKITNTDPFTCRIYGMLGIHAQKQLEHFFDSLGSKQEILMDFLNFEGMGTILYDNFRKLNSQVPKLTWMIKKENDWVKKQLIEIGISENDIIEK